MGTSESLWKNGTERYFLCSWTFSSTPYLPGSSEQRIISTKSETSSLFCGNEIKNSMRPLKSYSKIKLQRKESSKKEGIGHHYSIIQGLVLSFY